MALSELEIKVVLYLGILLFFALYHLEDGKFKQLLNLTYYPLALILVTNSVGTYFGGALASLIGYIGVAIFLNASWIMFNKTIPESERKERVRLLGGRDK